MTKSWARVRDAVAGLDAAAVSFVIRVLEDSALGPIAFVDGDLDAARLILGERGLDHVYRYDHGPEGGGDPAYHVSQAVSWLLGEAADHVRSVVGDAPGYVGMRRVPMRGCLELYWWGVVPPEVAAIVGTLPNGSRLDPLIMVPFSLGNLRQAQEAVSVAIRTGVVHAEMSMLGIDHDFSGLFVGVVEPDEARRAEIAEQLRTIVDVPVEVMFEERWTACVE